MATFLKWLTFLLLKLMRVKHNFSQSPVDYHKVRKTDRKNPPKYFHRNFQLVEEAVHKTKLLYISAENNNTQHKELILYIPGGAFISGPSQIHWDAVSKIVAETNKTVCLVDYPKAPESSIHQIHQNIDATYRHILQKVTADKLILIGDSVGATLIMTLVQRLITKNEKAPSALVLITPVFDASMSNEDIDAIDKVDPMLSKKGILSAKKMCAKELNLKSPIISPLYGDFNGFPKTMVFIGGKDIMYPDGVLGIEKMKKAGIELDAINAPEMPHVYPLLPIMLESQEAFSRIIASMR